MVEEIRVRAGIAVVQQGKILLVPHFNTDADAIQWVIPGGRVQFGERLQEAAIREFREETGLHAQVMSLLEISEVILPDRPWHSITITFAGEVTGGELAAEANHAHGEKAPRWFAKDEIEQFAYHPKSAVEKALHSQGGN